uniref:Uncharacterized protein n=1 Tax=Panagrolaimus sp. ES5 TaxID=591445 RepID=A0AC34FLU0_9BILA
MSHFLIDIDGIRGINGNRKFADCYYFYCKCKDELIDEKTMEEIKEGLQQKCCISYINAIEECLVRSKALCGKIQKGYLNWLRWNKNLILIELERFQGITLLKDYLDKIDEIKNMLKDLIRDRYEMTPEENGIMNEYTQAIGRIKRGQVNGNSGKKLCKQTGELFGNYVNILTSRYYIDTIGDTEYSLEKIKSEAELIIEKLHEFNLETNAAKVQNICDLYDKFCANDDAAKKGQDNAIKNVLKLAHKRATATMLERHLETINDTIEAMKIAAKTKITEIKERFKFNAKAVLTAFITTVPWLTPIYYASVTLGAIALSELFFPAFLIETLISSVFVTTLFPCALFVGVDKLEEYYETSEVHNDLKYKLDNVEFKKLRIFEENEKYSDRISKQIDLDAAKREALKKAEQKFDAEVKLGEEAMRQSEKKRNEKIDGMNGDEIAENLDIFENMATELKTELDKSQKEQQEPYEDILQSQKDLDILQQAEEVIARQVKKAAEKKD